MIEASRKQSLLQPSDSESSDASNKLSSLEFQLALDLLNQQYEDAPEVPFMILTPVIAVQSLR